MREKASAVARPRGGGCRCRLFADRAFGLSAAGTRARAAGMGVAMRARMIGLQGRVVGSARGAHDDVAEIKRLKGIRWMPWH